MIPTSSNESTNPFCDSKPSDDLERLPVELEEWPMLALQNMEARVERIVGAGFWERKAAWNIAESATRSWWRVEYQRCRLVSEFEPVLEGKVQVIPSAPVELLEPQSRGLAMLNWIRNLMRRVPGGIA